MNTSLHPKRLIEVDLPIRRISEFARKEKSIRQGHLSTLHIWWARRPMAACRAVLCASLWPDPADSVCPQTFISKAKDTMNSWASNNLDLASQDSYPRLNAARKNNNLFDDKIELRNALLDFIADFSKWENSNNPSYLRVSKELTAHAQEALGYASTTKPVVVDPFAGGGSFPLEAARLGASAFAGDYNILAWTINRLQLDWLPQSKQKASQLHTEWTNRFLTLANERLSQYYPKEANGDSVVVYLWARTIKCEGPGCGATVPILKTTSLGARSGKHIYVDISYSGKTLKTDITDKKTTTQSTSKRASVTCPCCGYTTPRPNVAKQAISQGFGYHLYAIGTRKEGVNRTFYRNPTAKDFEVLASASKRISYFEKLIDSGTTAIPNEELPYLRSIFNVRVYGIDKWRGLFTDRQLVSALELTSIFRQLASEIKTEIQDHETRRVLTTSLALSLSNALQYQCNIATWLSESVKSAFIQGQSLPMKMDFVEANPLFPGLAGGLEYSFEKHRSGLEYLESFPYQSGESHRGSATEPFLPEDSTDLILTDPPYYDVVPYADCSDFFNVWLYRMLKGNTDIAFPSSLSDKNEEIVQLAERNERYKARTKDWFENKLAEALTQWNSSIKPTGRMVIVFAHKQTSAWEALINAVLRAGWVVTASWPLETENAARMRANESAVLSSSIHLVCQPRPRGKEEIGDWREVLSELPKRIHEWMPRLAREGIVGADAIFACIGPALEIFSKYSRVEKASGEEIPLKEYLEHVWASVAREALTMIFTNADAAGFEEDARLTAMWLWTLNAGNSAIDHESLANEENDEESESGARKPKATGFLLEYDAARKIAQGFGAHLEDLSNLVEITGDTARLLPVSERVQFLFGRPQLEKTQARTRKKDRQLSLGFEEELKQLETEDAEFSGEFKSKPGKTILDKLHQSMILFGAGRTEALRRLLVDEGAGKDARFWRLAQALSALYPDGTDEKRWVDGVSAKKKGFGL